MPGRKRSRDDGDRKGREDERDKGRGRSRDRSKERRRPRPELKKIEVLDLTRNVTKEHLQEIFATYGKVAEIDYPFDRMTFSVCGSLLCSSLG